MPNWEELDKEDIFEAAEREMEKDYPWYKPKRKDTRAQNEYANQKIESRNNEKQGLIDAMSNDCLESWDYKKSEAAYAATNRAKICVTACERCGSSNHLHRHHPNYNKPLFVIGLCRKCHIKEHVKLRAQKKLVLKDVGSAAKV